MTSPGVKVGPTKTLTAGSTRYISLSHYYFRTIPKAVAVLSISLPPQTVTGQYNTSQRQTHPFTSPSVSNAFFLFLDLFPPLFVDVTSPVHRPRNGLQKHTSAILLFFLSLLLLLLLLFSLSLLVTIRCSSATSDHYPTTTGPGIDHSTALIKWQTIPQSFVYPLETKYRQLVAQADRLL